MRTEIFKIAEIIDSNIPKTSPSGKKMFMVKNSKYYLISKDGYVYSIKRKIIRTNGRVCVEGGKYLQSCYNNSGYKGVSFNKNPIGLHVLLAMTFIENPLNKQHVNHKNGVKDDNRIENLEWCTRSENMIHSVCVLNNKPYINPSGEESKFAKPVWQFSITGQFLKRWACASDAAKKLNLIPHRVCNCANGHRKSSGGYIWIYESLIQKIDE